MSQYASRLKQIGPTVKMPPNNENRMTNSDDPGQTALLADSQCLLQPNCLKTEEKRLCL